jgi:hypothetical protein
MCVVLVVLFGNPGVNVAVARCASDRVFLYRASFFAEFHSTRKLKMGKTYIYQQLNEHSDSH